MSKKSQSEFRNEAIQRFVTHSFAPLDESLKKVKEAGVQLVAKEKQTRRENEKLNSELEEALLRLETEKQEKEEWKTAATHDPLTGLLNRRGLDMAVEKEVEAVLNFSDAEVVGCVLYLDIDHFKQINTEFDHDGGDKVLVSVSQNLAKRFRSTDLVSRPRTEEEAKKDSEASEDESIVSRIGGEEIVVFFPNATAEQVLERIKSQNSGQPGIHISVAYPKKTIAFSGGIAEVKRGENLQETMQNLEAAKKRANSTMNIVKKTGRDRVEISSDGE